MFLLFQTIGLLFTNFSIEFSYKNLYLPYDCFSNAGFAYKNNYFLFFKYFLSDLNKYLTKGREHKKGSIRRAPLQYTKLYYCCFSVGVKPNFLIVICINTIFGKDYKCLLEQLSYISNEASQLLHAFYKKRYFLWT